MSRSVTNRTKLGVLILNTRKPMYVISAEVGIAFSQLSRYVNLREPIRPNHLIRLSQYFGVDVHALIGPVDSDPGGPGTGTAEDGG